MAKSRADASSDVHRLSNASDRFHAKNLVLTRGQRETLSDWLPTLLARCGFIRLPVTGAIGGVDFGYVRFDSRTFSTRTH